MNGYTRAALRRHWTGERDVEYRYDQIRTEDAQRAAAVFEVRGEVYMSDESFLAAVKRSGRSFGRKSRLKTRATRRRGRFDRKTRRLRRSARWIYFVFNIQVIEGETITTHADALKRLHELGFTVSPLYCRTGDIETVIEKIREIGNEARHVLVPD